MMTRSVVRMLLSALVAAVMAVTSVAASPASADRPRHHRPRLLPVVFVHGQSGSAQQFETQAMRFTSNGYPQHLLFAFEYDTSSAANPLADLDAFLDEVLAETGAEQVYAVGHSRGTGVWTTYLTGEGGFDGAAKVAKYVNIDGRTLPDLPGGVPTIGIWGEWNTDAQIGPDPAANFHFDDKSHTEVATSAEAFAAMFELLTGRRPFTTAVLPQVPGQVTVAGRAVLFPQNMGRAGTTVEVWRVDPATGHRIGARPRATFPIDDSGDFGPVRVHPRWHYEFAIVADEGTHHFYTEPFPRSDHFLRLNTSPPGGPLDAIVPDSDTTTNLVVTRMREFWGDQGEGSDRLEIDGTDVVVPATSPRAGVNLAVFVHDDGLDGVTDLGKGELPPFDALPFLTAVDVAIAASPDGSGTVSVVDVPRRDGEPTEINVPNWPSSTDAVSVQFHDFEPRFRHFPW